MNDENYTINVKQVDITSGFSEHEPATGKKKGKKKQQQQNSPKALQHFEEIRNCAGNANTTLAEKGSPYRFHAYRLDEDIFVDLVILDISNKTKQIVKKNITDEEFMKTIEQIENLDGFFVDCKV